MKNLFLIVIMLLSLNSCVAQKYEPIPVVTIPLTVITISGEDVTMKSESGHFLMAKINESIHTIPTGLKLEEGRVYFVAFQHIDADRTFKRKIEIIGYSTDPAQSLKDKAKIATQFKNFKG